MTIRDHAVIRTREKLGLGTVEPNPQQLSFVSPSRELFRRLEAKPWSRNGKRSEVAEHVGSDTFRQMIQKLI